MGTIHHHAILVTGWDESLDKAYQKAAEIFPWVSPISPEGVNSYRSFFIPPDGSKEGWEDSDKGDARRKAFFKFLGEQERFFVEVVLVGYGEYGFTCDSLEEVLKSEGRDQ